jgi:hypothetical protein
MKIVVQLCNSIDSYIWFVQLLRDRLHGSSKWHPFRAPSKGPWRHGSFPTSRGNTAVILWVTSFCEAVKASHISWASFLLLSIDESSPNTWCLPIGMQLLSMDRWGWNVWSHDYVVSVWPLEEYSIFWVCSLGSAGTEPSGNVRDGEAYRSFVASNESS